MHGNPADRHDTLPRTELWFGTPEGRAHFDLATLSIPEKTRLQAFRNRSRIEDFQVSRALRAHAGVPMPASSLSHSGGYAALLQTSGWLKVGVDVEAHRQRDLLRIATFAFCQAEIDALAATLPTDRARLFYGLWTAKEALAKALDLPLMDALRLCSFVPSGTTWKGEAPTDQPWFIRVFEPRAGVSLAAAGVGPDWQIPIASFEWPVPQAAPWPLIASAAAPAVASALPATAAGTACAAAGAVPD
jgi:hypothetical protein